MTVAYTVPKEQQDKNELKCLNESKVHMRRSSVQGYNRKPLNRDLSNSINAVALQIHPETTLRTTVTFPFTDARKYIVAKSFSVTKKLGSIMSFFLLLLYVLVPTQALKEQIVEQVRGGEMRIVYCDLFFSKGNVEQIPFFGCRPWAFSLIMDLLASFLCCFGKQMTRFVADYAGNCPASSGPKQTCKEKRGQSHCRDEIPMPK